MTRIVIILIFCTSSSMWSQDLSDYILLEQTKSISGTHNYYQEEHEGLSVFNSFARTHHFHRELLVKKVVIEGSPDEELFQNINTKNHQVKEVDSGYWFIDGSYLKAIEKEVWVESDYPYQVVFANDVLVHVAPLFSSLKDSAAYCNVFYPNPIASSGQLYGAPYFDNNDLSNMELQRELIRKKVTCKFENGMFNVRSGKVNMVDISLPVNPIPLNSQDQFVFIRSQPEFEVMNAYFHLSNFMDFVGEELGFTSLFTKQLQVDVHALSDADNSIYIGVSAQPQILFGDGGVDDAEDGQVVIHELSHAITDATSPGSNIGLERNAVDEGIGDYLAGSYTRYLLPNSQWEKVPSWDGHNEFWAGRQVNADKKYPESLEGGIYQDGEIWSSMLTLLENKLGRDLTHKLLVESSFLYHEQMSMREAAKYFIKADSLLNGGVNSVVVRQQFCSRGLMLDCDSSSFYEGIVTVGYEGFGHARLSFSKNVAQFNELEIYDMGGGLVYKVEEGLSESLDLRGLSTGVYVVRFGNSNKFQVLKVVLF